MTGAFVALLILWALVMFKDGMEGTIYTAAAMVCSVMIGLYGQWRQDRKDG